MTINLLNYAVTHFDDVYCYHARNVKLKIHTNVSYLVEPEAKIHISVYHFLPDTLSIVNYPPEMKRLPNKPIHTECCIIENTLAPEQTEATICNALEESGKPKPDFPRQTDNSTACGIAKKKDKDGYAQCTSAFIGFVIESERFI